MTNKEIEEIEARAAKKLKADKHKCTTCLYDYQPDCDDCSECTYFQGKGISKWEPKEPQDIPALLKDNKRLRELVDGAMVAVEIFTVGRPGQQIWKDKWLKNAKQALKE